MTTKMETYKILRFRLKGATKIIKKGLTLEQARIWCKREDTHKKVGNKVIWFDGYTKE